VTGAVEVGNIYSKARVLTLTARNWRMRISGLGTNPRD
jgi:hypothetical protein